MSGDSTRVRERRWFGKSKERKQISVPRILIVPAAILVLFAHWVAAGAGAWYAFTDWDGFSEAEFVGLANFATVFRGGGAGGALSNTLVMAITVFVLVNILGLVLALGLNSSVRSRHLIRALIFLPAIASPVATTFIWRYLFEFDGPINDLLGAVGLETWQRAWLGDPEWAMWAVVIVLVWQYVGLPMIIFLAGLQSIPQELHEAAAVDGAKSWTRFRRITLPLLAPAVTVSATLTLILSVRVFEQVLALTNGGPAGATETLATQVYKQAFALGEYGLGTAYALTLAALVGLLTLVQLVILRSRERRIAG